MGSCQHPHHHHPEHQEAPAANPAEVVAQCIQRVLARGMRRTRLLKDVLMNLALRNRPVTIAMLAESLGEVCDPASLYRMVERLVEAGVLRRIGLQERAMYYELALPGQHRDYLICQGCGAIGDINAACPVDVLEAELARRTGYSGLHHELVFYGLCPECRKEPEPASR